MPQQMRKHQAGDKATLGLQMAGRMVRDCSDMDKSVGSHVRMVDSWPPPWLAVEVKSPTGLPTSAPFCHRLPVASQNALN